MRLSPLTTRQIDSPFGSVYEYVAHRSGTRELLDLAQAAPSYPAAQAVVEHVRAVAADPHGGDYTPIAGLPHLRTAFAAELSAAYRGEVHSEHVLVTAGGNQAFCMVVSALADPGDEVVVALPYYPNHDMWLRLSGITPVYLDPGPARTPTAGAAEALITERTRAIVIVSPGNPTGATLRPAEIAEFAALADRHGIALVLDETYRTFRDSLDPPHGLFATPAWERSVVSLHSFSKDFAIPGYRVGAAVGSPRLLREVMKLLDCVSICTPRIGQEAAWAGLTMARPWRADRAREVAGRRRAFEAVMAGRPGGFELLSAGGFFGWIRHPFTGCPTEQVVRDLAVRQDTLLLPGTAFQPGDAGTLRVSLGNVGEAAFADLADRLERAACG